LGGISAIADGVDEVRKAVRENIRQGADHIKIMAGGGVSSPGDKLVHPQYSLEEITAIVDEAERSGRYVMAHVYSDVGIGRAVSRGVRSIEHGNFLKPDTAKLMHDKGAHLVPTLITYEADAKYGMSFGWSEENAAKNAEVLASGLRSLEVALEQEVNVGYGTDLCWSPKIYQADGLLIHQKVCGAAEALRHATLNNAKVIRMEGMVGEIVPGAFADLVILDADPSPASNAFPSTRARWSRSSRRAGRSGTTLPCSARLRETEDERRAGIPCYSRLRATTGGRCCRRRAWRGHREGSTPAPSCGTPIRDRRRVNRIRR